MTGPLVAALAAAMAVLLLLPHPGRPVIRIRAGDRPRPTASRSGPTWWKRLVTAVTAAALAWLLVPGTPGLVAAPLAAGAAVLALRLLRATPVDGAELLAQLPMTLEFLAVALDAGRPVAHAVDAVTAVTPEPTRGLLRRVSGQLALGRAGPEAWRELRDDPVWGQVARDVARAERSGTALADVLRTHAEDARRDCHDEAQKAARRVGVRSVVPLMVCFLPAFILVGVVPIIAGLLSGFLG